MIDELPKHDRLNEHERSAGGMHSGIQLSAGSERFRDYGRGINEVNKTKNPTRHAEFVAIEEAEQWCKDSDQSFDQVMRNTSLYVTLEPCIMCASALYLLEIRKIVFGACNPRFGGLKSVASNEQYQHDHQIELISEVDVDRSISLLKRFYGRENRMHRKTKEEQSKECDTHSDY
uniref:CMP/dCMP-type deaminase domain-containing protein n=1 Tax=Ditylenchus dipsaci TaxID=166011 RepID=A0A915ELC1_9BILA